MDRRIFYLSKTKKIVKTLRNLKKMMCNSCLSYIRPEPLPNKKAANIPERIIIVKTIARPIANILLRQQILQKGFFVRRFLFFESGW